MNTFKKQTIIACTPVKAQTSALINHNRSGSNPSVKSQSSDVIARSCSIQRPASAPNIDIHDSYMVRTHRSEKKLNNFFGDNDVPFDITISEIEASGLKAMLQSKVPLCYFLSSLLEDYCSENLVCISFYYKFKKKFF